MEQTRPTSEGIEEMKLYIHVFNVDPDEWDTRNVGIVSESPDPMEDTDIRMDEFGHGPFRDTPRVPYEGDLIYEIIELVPGVEIRGNGYDRCSLEVGKAPN